ncbi:hypothetical protein D3C85_449930 [compost metagenome]
MRFAQAGQAEQPAQWLAKVTDRFVRRHERQARALDRLLAVQPPQAIAQGQRFNLLQDGRKTVAHTIGLTQQPRAPPDQLFEIFGTDPQTDHLGIQRQLLRGALQQLEQGFGRTGSTQCLAQVGFTQGASQQLQQV